MNALEVVLKTFEKHAGRPGQVGGSLPKGRSAAKPLPPIMLAGLTQDRDVVYSDWSLRQVENYAEGWIGSDWKTTHRIKKQPGDQYFLLKRIGKRKSGTPKAVAKPASDIRQPVTDDWLVDKKSPYDSAGVTLNQLNAWADNHWGGNREVIARLRDAFEIEYAGFKSVITEINDSYGNNNLAVKGDVLNKSGGIVGTFTRYFYGNKNEVHHDYFKLYDTRDEGSGFGSAFYQNSEAQYEKMGVKKISLFANLSVGGYAWARMGYDFDEESKLENALARLNSRIQSNYTFKQIDEYEKNDKPKLKHSWDIAAYKGPDGRAIGKEVLLGSDWSAFKDITPDSLGLKVGKEYYETKRKAKAA